jgi:hypothetical protein
MATSKRPSRRKPLNVGDRVRAKTTGRVGAITDVQRDGTGEHLTVAYDLQPQDAYLTTPACRGAALPRELIDREK